MCFAWYVWDKKEIREQDKNTVLKWIPNHQN